MGAEIKPTTVACIVRRFEPSDTAAVRDIFAQSPQAGALASDSYERLSESEGPPTLVSDLSGEVTGVLLSREVADEAELLNLAALPKYRRHGHGRALVLEALAGMRSRGVKSVYLEVRESNSAAIAFYASLGFAKTGIRKGYYRGPDEAALTMVRKLTG